jgi:hypothetical protein
LNFGQSIWVKHPGCRNPTLGKVGECNSHSQKWRLGVLRDSWKLRRRFEGSNLLALARSLYQWKALEMWCPKWPCIAHLDICSPSYEQKKGRDSNCQFDSRPQKVKNRPLPDVALKSATWLWKALNESYNFGLGIVPIWIWGEELWPSKVPGLQPWTISGLQLGSPGKKSHSDVASVVRRKEYYMGEGGGFPRVRAVVNQVVQSARGLSQHPRVFPNVN